MIQKMTSESVFSAMVVAMVAVMFAYEFFISIS